MKKIIAVNAGPRKNWNTAQLINAACEGAKEEGAEVKVYNMYDLEKYSGCISCFGCKLEKNLGHCICKDGLTPVLEDIRTADGLIIGSPNYLSDVTAAFRAIYERLIFQYITYKKEQRSYNDRQIPVLFIMTSNAPDAAYEEGGMYDGLIKRYQGTFSGIIGPTKVVLAADTKQVNNYDIYNWTMFDAAHKIARHEEVFGSKLEEAKAIGKEMAQ